MVDDAEYIRVAPRQIVGYRRCPVLRTVVDGDDLESGRQGGQRRQRLVHEGLEVGLLVVGREEERQFGDPAGPGCRISRACQRQTFACVQLPSFQPLSRSATQPGDDLIDANAIRQRIGDDLVLGSERIHPVPGGVPGQPKEEDRTLAEVPIYHIADLD